jgi:hypothetical protein
MAIFELVTKNIWAPIIASILVAYLTTKYSIRREQRYGQLRLLEICRRYTVNLINAYDHETGQIKKGALYRNIYIAELEVIVRQFEELTQNEYFGKLVSKFSDISFVMFVVRRELTEQRNLKTLDAMNTATVGSLRDLYYLVKKDVPNKFTDSQIDQTICEFYEENKNLLPPPRGNKLKSNTK